MRYTPSRALEAVNAAFLRVPREEILALLAKREALSIRHGMTMLSERGRARVIEIQLRPWVVSGVQRRFFHRHCLLLRHALSRMMPLYLENPKARQILPLSPEEHAWVTDVNKFEIQRPQAVMDRLDATATFASPDWRNYWFLEPNSVGIGGVHYIPAACALTERWILPLLRAHLPGLRLDYQDDIRQLLLKLFIRHARAIGRRFKVVALVEDRSGVGGTEEFHAVARYLSRYGVTAFVADPRQVELRKGEVAVSGRQVDLLYRDSEIREMKEMFGKRWPQDSAPLREAFIRNQVISSIAGEFDHKSSFEILTNPEFSRHFTLRQRLLFRDHVLWTRLLWERVTTDPRGKAVDLIRYARRHRETLTLKPNRAYGGKGVVFGHRVTPLRWERELERALKRPFTHVLQKAAPVRAELFPVASAAGHVQLQPYFAVSGFAATGDGIAFLGRSSKESVVNVSRRGGLIAVWRLG